MGSRISYLLFATGMALIGYSIISGGANAGLFIIFPFVYGSSIFLFLGIIFIFASMLVFPFEFSHGSDVIEKKTKAGGMIMIGPFPIIITNDEDMGKILFYIAIAMIALMLVIAIYSILLIHQ